VRMNDSWFKMELDILRKLYIELQIPDDVMFMFVKELYEMNRVDYGIMHFVILQSRRDRALKPYLDEYNKRRCNGT
jgi:hypothetical protein